MSVDFVLSKHDLLYFVLVTLLLHFTLVLFAPVCSCLLCVLLSVLCTDFIVLVCGVSLI